MLSTRRLAVPHRRKQGGPSLQARRHVPPNRRWRLPARNPFLRSPADALARFRPARRVPAAAFGDRDAGSGARHVGAGRGRHRGRAGGGRDPGSAHLVLRQSRRSDRGGGVRAHRLPHLRRSDPGDRRSKRSTACISTCTAPRSRSISRMRRASCSAGSGASWARCPSRSAWTRTPISRPRWRRSAMPSCRSAPTRMWT